MVFLYFVPRYLRRQLSDWHENRSGEQVDSRCKEVQADLEDGERDRDQKGSFDLRSSVEIHRSTGTSATHVKAESSVDKDRVESVEATDDKGLEEDHDAE